ncbi:MAG: hypothetical protein JW700_04175 [Candidatus Aenigmarchaeota archaeon]|nr:hypothetical protein [Candidatus Aenigmarchaeota archaeon]
MSSEGGVAMNETLAAYHANSENASRKNFIQMAKQGKIVEIGYREQTGYNSQR